MSENPFLSKLDKLKQEMKLKFRGIVFEKPYTSLRLVEERLEVVKRDPVEI